MKLYYFLASLPSLAFGNRAPCTTQEFVDRCRRSLAPAEVAELERFLDGDRARLTLDAAREFHDRETQIRNAVARRRAARLGRDASAYLHPHGSYAVWLERDVEQHLAAPDPLARETALDRVRFELLHDLARSDRFGLAAVLAYGLQLRILERWQGLSDPVGRERLEQALASTTVRA